MVSSVMTSEKLKAPLHEDDGSDFEKYRRKKRSRKIQIVAGVCILVVLNVSFCIFTLFYTMSRIKKLEYKVESLKNTLSQSLGDINIVDATIADTIERLHENWDNLNDALDKTGNTEEPDQYAEDFDESSDYFDYDNYDQSELNDTEADGVEVNVDGIQYAINYTKEGRETAREKRNIIATTQDGVLINSESYAERRARNITKSRNRNRPTIRYAVTPPSAQLSSKRPSFRRYNSTVYTSTSYRTDPVKQPSTPPVYVRRSRVKHTEDKSKAFRQVVKKSSLKSGDTLSNGDGYTSDTEFTVVREENLGRRRYRPPEILDERHPRTGRARLPSVHYSGDTSRYVVGQHTNFNGNGHLRHPQRTFVDWKVSDWVKSARMDTHFTMDEGVVTIKEPGVYFVYAQIYYLDEHDTIGFRVHKNSESILQCTVTAHSTERRLKGNTCYTAGTEYLAEGDTISLADITNGRYSLFEPGKSFFGLVKFGDIKIN